MCGRKERKERGKGEENGKNEQGKKVWLMDGWMDERMDERMDGWMKG